MKKIHLEIEKQFLILLNKNNTEVAFRQETIRDMYFVYLSNFCIHPSSNNPVLHYNRDSRQKV
ncbi:MAG: hypothetical protein IH852_17290 [Bacteroidetes bacterium]|nr:hypothetical protein [Bacteroidota bacterium]